MKLLADENIDAAIVEWLRREHHDVRYAAESTPAQSDPALLRIALEQSRILLTADLDFGEIVVRQRQLATGVILLRFRAKLEADHLRLFQLNWAEVAGRAAGHFVVVRNRRVRVRPIPTASES